MRRKRTPPPAARTQRADVEGVADLRLRWRAVEEFERAGAV